MSAQRQDDKLDLNRISREKKKSIKRSMKSLQEYVEEISESNPKEFLSYVNNRKSLTCTIRQFADDNNIHKSDENGMVAGGQILNGVLNEESDILCSFDKMKEKQSSSRDKTAPRILKKIKHEFCKSLSIIFNTFLTTGKVPPDWKLASVTPFFFFFNGDTFSSGNYRAIILTSIV